MKWEDLKRSTNVEDLRSQGYGGRMNFGSGRGANLLIPIIHFLLRTNIGGIVLVIGVVAYFMGYNPLTLLDTQSQTHTNTVVSQSDDDRNAQFVAAVLG